MSTNSGFEGKSFIENTCKKLDQLKYLIKHGKYFNKTSALIQINGGIDGFNAIKIVDSKANVIVSRIYVFKSENQ